MVGLVEGGWDRGLRDASLDTWSRPTKSKALDKLHKDRTFLVEEKNHGYPRLSNCARSSFHAAAMEDEKKLMRLCQKPPAQRTDDEINFIRSYMHQWHFFQLWPDAVQYELARVLLTEVRACHETVISRGSPLTKVFFLLRGLLQLCVPDTTSSPLSTRPPPLPRESTRASLFGVAASTVEEPKERQRVLALLKKGDTCGEALLLGNETIAHADVVVNSSGAVVLSLCYGDFLRALKEILGLRQQDRLMYLRMHPLFVDVSLEDIDRASDFLTMAFHPPGTQLYPQRGEDGQKIYFIAEGECSVRRRGSHRPAHHPDADRAPKEVCYDADTFSLLGPQDMFGLDPPGRQRPSAGGACPEWVVECHTQVKAYSMTMQQFQDLPLGMQKAIEDACAFKGHYLGSRMGHLSKLDAARANPAYGAVAYKLGGVTMTTMGPLVGQLLLKEAAQDAATAAGTSRQAPVATATNGSFLAGSPADGLGNKLARGPPPRHFTAGQGQVTHAAPGVDLTLGPDSSFKTGVDFASSTGGSPSRMQAPVAGRRSHAPRSPTVPGRQQEKQQQQQEQQQQQAQGRPHGPVAVTVPIGALHPDTTTWSKLDIARNRTVETEAPRPQPVPSTLRQAHVAMFRAAQHKSPRGRGISVSNGDASDDDEDFTPVYKTTRQPSRRLSARLRHSYDEPDRAMRTPSWSGSGAMYEGRATTRWSPGGAGTVVSPRWCSNGSEEAAGVRWGSGGSSGDTAGADSCDANAGRDSAAAAARVEMSFSTGASAAVQLPPLPGGVWQHQHEQALQEADRNHAHLAAAEGGQLNQTLRKGASGGPGTSPRDRHDEHQAIKLVRDGHQGMPDQQQPQHGHLAGDSAGLQHRRPAGRRASTQPHDMQAHALDADGSGLGGGSWGEDASRAVPSRSPSTNGAAQQQEHQPAQQQQQQQQSQQHLLQQQQQQQQQRGGGGQYNGMPPDRGPPGPHVGNVVGLPASVVLGYENLDPFQWAALMSHMAVGYRDQGPQERVLPKPKW